MHHELQIGQLRLGHVSNEGFLLDNFPEFTPTGKSPLMTLMERFTETICTRVTSSDPYVPVAHFPPGLKAQ